MLEELIQLIKTDILLFIENTVKQLSPKDRGGLVNSWFINQKQSRIFNTARYSIFQNYGTKPIKNLPMKPIREWARRKGIKNWFGVWLKIKSKGIKPKHFVEQALLIYLKHKNELFKKSIEAWRRKIKQ